MPGVTIQPIVNSTTYCFGFQSGCKWEQSSLLVAPSRTEKETSVVGAKVPALRSVGTWAPWPQLEKPPWHTPLAKAPINKSKASGSEKASTPLGMEPRISGSVDRRLIRWAMESCYNAAPNAVYTVSQRE